MPASMMAIRTSPAMSNIDSIVADLHNRGMAVDEVPRDHQAERENRRGNAESVLALVEAAGRWLTRSCPLESLLGRELADTTNRAAMS